MFWFKCCLVDQNFEKVSRKMSENLVENHTRNLEEARKKLAESHVKQRECLIELKINNLLYEVFRCSYLGQVVLIPKGNPYSTLESTFRHYKLHFCIHADFQRSYYQLKINEMEYASGYFSYVDQARSILSQTTLQKLQETCFTIIPKNDFRVITRATVLENYQPGSVNVTAGQSQSGVTDQQPNVLVMGVNNLLRRFIDNSDLRSLSFEGFTREEMIEIVQAARLFHVPMEIGPTKIVVSNRINRMDIVRRLLKSGGLETEYCLYIPLRFQHFWFNQPPF